ncbi:MAG: hypothetical protein PF541_05930 [Prolixibacteraceae bacterium]|nr:hypothetical protein [Prolixibacteraceae bacterium]
MLLQYTTVKENDFVNNTIEDSIICNLNFDFDQYDFVAEDIEDIEFKAINLCENFSYKFVSSNAIFSELNTLKRKRFITLYSTDLSPPYLTF